MTALSELTQTHLDCRDLRHAWDRLGFYVQQGKLLRQLTCTRCGATRTDTWSRDGRQRISGRYEYPDGYLIPGGGIKSRDVRREAVNRATVYASETDMLESLVRRTNRRRAS